MALRVDPRFPLIWRTPQSLQFGLDRPRTVLDEVSPADERLISALVAGVSRSGADMIGRAAGLDDDSISALLRSLEPVLEDPKPSTAPGSIVVCGNGETAELLRRLFGEAGSTLLSDTSDASPDLAVIVAHYVMEPEHHGYWLRRDIPHLGIVFGDSAVRIGPLVTPGSGPCLYCLEHHRSDADPARAAIVSQLWGRRSAAETSLTAAEAAAIAVRLLRRPEASRFLGSVDSIDLDIETGSTRIHPWVAHPDCFCRDIEKRSSVGAESGEKT